MRRAAAAVLVVLAGSACGGVTRDECDTRDPPRCDGDVLVTCIPNKLTGHTMRDDDDCGPEQHCIQQPDYAFCAADDTPCDPATFVTRMAPAGAGQYELLECNIPVSGKTYRTRTLYQACDPATYKPTCDKELVSACLKVNGQYVVDGVGCVACDIERCLAAAAREGR